MRRKIFYVFLLLISTSSFLRSQAWEEIYYENFGAGYTGQPLPSSWTQDANGVFNGSVYGATGANNDPCRSSLLRLSSSYLAYEMNLSDTYEYYISLNVKTDDTLGAQLAFYHHPTASASGTIIGSPIAVPIIPADQPGQLVSSATFSGLNGTQFFMIMKGPTDPSSGDERTRLDDFRLYRRPIGGINAPPTVNLTAPNDGDNISADSTIILTATANDSDGSIQSVKFYYDNTLISEDSTAPYEATLGSGLPAGSYTLKAEATDDDGSTHISQINITVIANIPPTITITAPNDGADFTEGTSVDFTAVASDSDGSIQQIVLYDGTTQLGIYTGNNATYTSSTLSVGTHTLKAIATDDDGDSTESQISINIQAPPSSDWELIYEENFGTGFTGQPLPPNWEKNIFNGNVEGATGGSDDPCQTSLLRFYSAYLAYKMTLSDSYEYYASMNLKTDDPAGMEIAFYHNPTAASNGTVINSSVAVPIIPANQPGQIVPSATFGGLNGDHYFIIAKGPNDPSGGDNALRVDDFKLYRRPINIGPTAQCISIGQGADDVEEWPSGNVKRGQNTIELINDANDGDQLVGLRFDSLMVPPGATVTSAYLQFTAAATNDLDPSNLTIHGQASDDPGKFLTVTNDVSGRPLTTASVAWSPPSWNTVGEADTAQQTSDLSAIVQEIVDRPGYATYNAIAFLINGTGRRSIVAYNDDPDAAAQLCITFDTTTVANVPPTVTLDSPTDGALFVTGNAINLNATANDTDGTIQSVQFYYDNTLIDEDLNTPYAANISAGLAAGTYILKAIATDNDGETAEAQINVTVEAPNVPPSVTIDAPVNGALFEEGETISIIATASDTDGTIQSVQFYYDNILIDEDLNSPYLANVGAGLTAGTYILKAIATDDDGDTAETQISITVQAPNIAPSIIIINPNDGAFYQEGESFTFHAVATDSDGSIQQIDLFEGNTLLHSLTPSSAPYAASHTITELSIGSYTLRAVATDDEGATAEELVYITVSTPTVVPDLLAIPSTNLGKGDLIFLGFDNDIGGDKDRIIVTNLVDLLPETSFMITNANYCREDEHWYSQDSLDGDIPVQRITYQGEDILPAGSAICFDIPADGDFMITDFMIDGNSTGDFIVQNVGQRAIPDINLRKDSTAGHLFLLQGGNWRFRYDFATYTGRSVAPPIQYGSTWDDGDCSTGSQLPGADECVAGPSFPTVGGSVYAYFDCSEYGSQYSPFAFMKEAIDTAKWDIEVGTDSLDFSGTACSMDCAIIQDSLYWVFTPDTLIVDCANNYQDSIQQWLTNNGNATAGSSCQDSVNITHTYPGLNASACDAGGQPVTFIATDNCGGRVTSIGLIQMNLSTPLSFDHVATDTTVQCSPDSVSIVLQEWMDRRGGASVTNTCLVNWEMEKSESWSPCGLIDTVWATFHAISVCGDTISTSAVFDVEDNIAPVFVTPPRDTTLSCNELDFDESLKTWLKKAGFAEYSDNCTSTILLDLTYDFPSFAGQCGTTLVTFTLSDGCGNATTATANLTIEDTAAPIITSFPTSHSIAINDKSFQESIYRYLEEDLVINAGLSDLCTTDSDSLIWIHDYTGQLTPGQCDSTIVNISIRDKCQNTIDTSLIIYAVDEYAPYFEIHPDTLSISCSIFFQFVFDDLIEDWKDEMDTTTVRDLAGSDWTINHTEIDSIQKRCGYYRVQFTVTDACGNSGSIIGIVEVTDDSPPYFIGGGIEPLQIPYGDTSNITTINEWLTGNQSARAGDNCTDSLSWSTSSFILTDTSCVQLPVTFYIHDGCNSTVDTSYIEIYNPILDTLSIGTDKVISACDDGGVQPWLDDQAGIRVSTQCGEVIDFDYELTGNSDCGIPQAITFTGETPWGETLTFIKTLTLQDNQAPTFDVDPQDITVNCADFSAENTIASWLASYGYAKASDECDSELNWSRNYASLPLTCGSTTVAFTVIDVCGNFTTKTATLSVLDQQAPTIFDPGNSLDIYLETSDLDSTGSNSRIETLIENWLVINGGANAVDSSFCEGQTVTPNCPGSITAFPYQESFESGFGDWSESTTTGAWQRKSGGTLSSDTGPTTAVDGDYYLFTEANGNFNEQAVLLGPCFNLNGVTHPNFSFQYHMYGIHIGDLQLEVTTDCNNPSAAWTSIWSATGEQGNQWLSASVSLSPYEDQCIQLRFVGNIGPITKSDMAIDDLELQIDQQSTLPPASSANLTWRHDYAPTNYAPTFCDTIPVTFTVEDDCGNEASIQHNIVIIDSIHVPVMDTLPQPLTIACNDPNFQTSADEWLDNFGYGHATDPEGGDVIWTHNLNKSIEPRCGQGEVTFTASNSCGGSVSHTVDLIIEDNNVPVIDTLAGQMYINSDWDLNTKTPVINSWLANQGGANATDSCLTELSWIDDFNSVNYDKICGTLPVIFTVSDDCENEATTTGNLIFYRSGFIVDSLPTPLELSCCGVDTIALNNWLNNQANAHITTTCGDELSWSHSNYDANALANCIDQSITFTGNTPYPNDEVYSFSAQITFTTTTCCDDVTVTLNQTGSSGNETIQASPTNCSSPLYTWYINGKPLPGYVAVTTSSIPYGLAGTGAYSVSVSCQESECEPTDTLDVCDIFTISLDCDQHIIYHSSDHQCEDDLERVWYRNDEFIAYNVDFVPFDTFGIYRLEATCDSICFDEVTLTLSCSSIDLEIIESTDSLRADIIGCYPPNETINWYIDNVIVNELAGQWTIEKLGNGLYRAELGFSNDPCIVSAEIDICEEMAINIIETVDGGLSYTFAAASKFPCYNSGTSIWSLDGVVQDTGSYFYPTQDGTYSVALNCHSGCTSSATYEWESPCTAMSVELVYIEDNFDKLDAIVTGGTRCVDLRYTWYRRNNGVTTISVEDGIYPHYYPPADSIGHFSVEVTCVGGGEDCSVSSNELFFTDPDCDIFSASIQESSNQLCAVVTGPACDVGAYQYIWERQPTGGGSITYLAGECIGILNNGTAYTYKLTVKCGGYCKAFAVYETVPCDIGATLTVNGSTLCVSASGTSCSGETPTYIWTRYDQVLPNVTGSCYTPLSSGRYAVEVVCGTNPTCRATSNEINYTYFDHCDLTASITKDNNGQLCATVGGTSCNGQTLSYSWSKNGVVYSTASCFTPSTNGFYKLTVSCQDQLGETCEVDQYYSYQIACDLSITITKNLDQLCATVGGNSCSSQAKIFDWYLDGVLLNNHGSCITPTQAGNYTVDFSCGDCGASANYSLPDCDLPELSALLKKESCAPGNPANCAALEVVSINFCSAPTVTIVPLSADGEDYSSNSSGTEFYVKPVGCYRLSASNNCTNGAGCPEVTTTYCFSSSGGSSLIRMDQPPPFNQGTTTSFHQLNIYPNPTQDEVNIAMQTHKAETLQLSFYDANGKIVLKDQVDLFEGQNQLQYQTDNLPEGVYIIRLQTKDELVHRKLMVIKQ